MKTLVSIITGRKDYPVFENATDQNIIDWLETDLSKDLSFNEDGNIYTSDDELQIISVEKVVFSK